MDLKRDVCLFVKTAAKLPMAICADCLSLGGFGGVPYTVKTILEYQKQREINAWIDSLVDAMKDAKQ